jgi:5-methyltetrahydropteroyltriglutamate--homocysteine methyltransferase
LCTPVTIFFIFSFAAHCGLSQTARWAAKEKMKNMVTGVHKVRAEL